MKKALLILCIIGLQYAYGAEDMPLVPMDSTQIEYKQVNPDLINVDNMRRKETVDKAKKQSSNNSPKFYIDKKQINEQRALDYMNQQNNALLPRF